MQTMTLTEFLEARLAEDEADASEASGGEEVGWHSVSGGVQADVRRGRQEYPIVSFTCASEHIARHDPARVLREVEAKRVIVRAGGSQCGSYVDPTNPEDVAREAEYCEYVGPERYASEQRDHWPAAYSPFCDGCAAAQSADHDREWVLGVIASVYADHPDYREEWRATT